MENENPPSVPADLNELQAQCAWLRNQILIVLILVLIVSGTLNVFLLRQWRYVNTDNKALKQQAEPLINEYQKVIGPRLDEFIRRVQDYGRTHADFQPIMIKYQLGPTSSPPASAAPAKK